MAQIRQLPPDLQKIAIEELNEVPVRVANDIEALKTWIEQQPYLKARTTDQFLLCFLRGCKFSLEKAKSKIDRYYTLRTKFPDFYTIQNVDDPRLLELIRLGVGLHLPTPLYENGPRLMLIRPGSYSPDQFSFSDIMCMAHGLQIVTMLEDDYTNVNGHINIMDMANVTRSHMFQMTPSVVNKMTIFAEEAVPLRQKATHFIHTPHGFQPIYNMVKPLMPTKQRSRLYIHGDNMESLYEHIPQKYLPKEYGGENGSITEIIKNTEAVFLEHRSYFLEELNYGTNEKLRPGKPIDDDNIYGIDGSFRQLNVD